MGAEVKRYDLDTFKKCSAPMAEGDFRAALEVFYAKIQAAREECLLQNVAIIVEHPIVVDDGDAPVTTFGGLGDSSALERMAAYALGAASNLRAEEVLAAQNRGRKRAGRK